MPYYVYKYENSELGRLKTLHLLEQFDVFREASKFAKTMRQELDVEEVDIIKVIFASNELEAETLLREKREPQPKTGDD